MSTELQQQQDQQLQHPHHAVHHHRHHVHHWTTRRHSKRRGASAGVMETGVVKAILADRLNENLQPEWQALFEDGNVQWLPEEAFREFDKSINDWVETEAWQKWVNEYGKPYEGRQVPYSSSAGTTPLSYA